MNKKNIFKDDVIEHIEDDIEKIRVRTGMYISYRGEKGALHLGRELTNNAIDVVEDEDTPGKNVTIHFDENTNELKVSDDAQGIPFDKVELISTKLQTGSKLNKKGGSNSAGENGVGLTAINALSKSLKYVIYRQYMNDKGEIFTEKGTFLFREGRLIDKKIEPSTKDKHGTTISFIPSEEILGKCNIPVEEYIAWVEKMSYIVSSKCNIKLSVLRKGKEVDTVYKFKRKNGFVDYMDVVNDKRLVAPISIKGQINDVKVQFAFTYNPTSNEETTDTFVNYVNTIDGGSHVNAARGALTSLILKQAKNFMTETELKKYDILPNDCKSGLVMIMNVFCDDPGFASQTKEKTDSSDLFHAVRTVVSAKLTKYFKDNPKELKKIIDYVKKVARARLEVTKIKKSDYESKDVFAENSLDNFDPATGNGYKELWLVEGNSAKGGLVKARDPRFQAIFALRGVSLNSFGKTISEVLTNKEFKTLTQLLGCGIGKDFDIKKLKYNKIIIMTDSDIDGDNITSLICAYFYMHQRQLVSAGVIYKGQAPLYLVDKADKKYVMSKSEYFDLCIEEMSRRVSISEDDRQYSRKEISEFLYRNRNYLDILKNVNKFYFIHSDIIEFLVKYRKHKDFIGKLRKSFDEVIIDKNNIEFIYEGNYQYIHLDEKFEDRVIDLDKYINEDNKGVLYYGFKDKDNFISSKMSIGAILRYIDTVAPVTLDRWKGLGSVPEYIFWDIAMNPAKRELIQLRAHDIEADLKKINILHGPEAALRRELLEGYKLNKEDIDN